MINANAAKGRTAANVDMPRRQFSERDLTTAPRPCLPDPPDDSLGKAQQKSAALGRRDPCANSLPPKPIAGRKRPTVTNVPLKAEMVWPSDRPPDCDQPAAAFATVLCDFRSKNRAWLITALTESALKGLVMRNAGSGACPVKKRSGKAVMKMTGTS